MRRKFTASLAAAAASALIAGLTAIGAAPAASAAVAPLPIVTGWFGYWASDSQVRTLAEQSQGVVDEVNIFWWTFNGADNPICVINPRNGVCDPSGSTPWTTDKYDNQRRILQDAGIRVLGSITDLSSANAGKLSEYLARSANRRDYARQIARYAENAGLDGVDLDWENFAFNDRNVGVTWAETRPRWINMIKRLSAELHERGLILSVTIPGGSAYWGGDTGVYALADIIEYTDRLRLMTYDYSWNVPGPIGPTNWARQQVQTAINTVGEQYAERLWVGNPQYGREWAINQGTSSNPDYGTNDKCPSAWSPGYYSTSGSWVSTTKRTLLPDGAYAVAGAYDIEPTWNSTYGEWTFTYSPKINGRYLKDGKYIEEECKVEREVWFGDTRSALADAQMVPDLGIGGIAVWNFGNVRDDFYPRMLTYGQKIAPAPTTLTASASSVVTYGRTAKVKVATDSEKGPSAGATATVLWSPTSEGAVTAAEAKAEVVDSVVLDSDGRATLRIPVQRTGYFWVEVSATDQQTAAASDPMRTRVRWKVNPESREYTTVKKQSISLAAIVAPERAGVTVRLQKLTDDGWRTLRKLTSDENGRVSGNVRVLRPQTATYRFVASNLDGYIRGTSARVSLIVTKN